MSDPVSGTTVAAGGLMGASVFGLATGIDYGGDAANLLI
ncbi:putative holin [Escherichia coli]